MRIADLNTDKAILEELGGRLRGLRLSRNISQAALAKEAGMARFTLQRIEDGQPSSMTNLIRLLRALDLLEELDGLVPESVDRPVDQLRRRSKPRRRAGSPKKAESAGPWKWGDEEGEANA
jgi:transcriptional regulator with XRE-family HTH domain